MGKTDDLIKVAQLAGASHRLAIELDKGHKDVDQAVDELHAITTDVGLLTRAAAPYTADDADRHRTRGAELLAAAGADMVEARRIWDERSRHGRGLSGLGDQR